jgi:hypothetical protein
MVMTSPAQPKRKANGGSPLRDIRYFESPGELGKGGSSDHAGTLYHITPAMDAWARRLAALCRQRQVSIGRPHHLYICFSSALREGEVRPTDFQLETWQRYVECGLPARFNTLSEEGRAERVHRATVESLAALAPKNRRLIEDLAALVDRSGDGLELMLLEKETRKYWIVIAHTIPPWPNPSELWMTIEERATGRSGRCKLIETKFEDEALFLAGKLSLVEGDAVVQPRASFDGTYYARQYNVSRFVVPIEALLQGKVPPRPQRAFRSRA